jgi:hypothetical protein
MTLHVYAQLTPPDRPQTDCQIAGDEPPAI